MALKINRNYFFNCLFLWKQNLPKRDSCTIFFTSDFLFMNKLDSMAKNMPKIAVVKLSSCGFKVTDFKKNYDCGIAELRLRSNISLKSCGIAIAEVLPSSCGIAVADSKKSCACPPNHGREKL
jgi:hypothetical protein